MARGVLVASLLALVAIVLSAVGCGVSLWDGDVEGTGTQRVGKYPACTAGATSCGGGCVDTSSDEANCGACGNRCAEGQACNAGACGFGDAGAGEGGKPDAATSVAACEPVLLLGTNGAASAELKNSLMATGAFCPVDFFDSAATAPKAADLAKYKAVLVYNDAQWSDAIAAAIGDALGTYYDGGGRVVVALFGDGGYMIKGAFGTVANGYMLFDPVTVPLGTDSLGTIAEPASPLVKDVKALSGNAWHGTQAVTNGGLVVASWNGGAPLIVRGVVKGRNRVDLNFHPLQGAMGQSWIGDGVAVVRNALLYR